MASGGWSPLPLCSSSYSASRSSFSIKNILNLPEDTSEEHKTIPSKSAQSATSSSKTLPLVPRVVRTSEHHTFANLPPCLPGFGFNFGGVSHLQPMNRFPFQNQGASLGMELIQRRRRRPLRKKKLRPLFSSNQIQTMENEFAKSRYVTESKRAELASDLNLTETQVKTWFQNRRTKWKKERREKGELPSPETQRKCDEAIEQVSPETNLNFCSFQYQMHPTVWTAEHSFSFPSLNRNVVEYNSF